MTERPLTAGDLEALRELCAADEESVLGVPSRLTVNDVRGWTSGGDGWLLEDGGELVAAGFARVRGDRGVAAGVVHPRAKGRGLGARLLERSEEHLGGRVVRIHQWTLGPDAAAHKLMLARGYRRVRTFYEMAIDVGEPPDLPDVPVETLRLEDVREVHATLDEAFEDHWEHQARTFDEWWEYFRSDPTFDVSLWFGVRGGGELAAAAVNLPNRNGGGEVLTLGVRRPWRGRGYAKALLLRTFREFHARGMPRVTLGVDAENPTGATHLYESVGMRVEQESVVFEKTP